MNNKTIRASKRKFHGHLTKIKNFRMKVIASVTLCVNIIQSKKSVIKNN